MIGGAPRAVWLTLGVAPGTVSVQSAAERLLIEGRPCHLIWDPVAGDVAQMVSVLRAGCALSAADGLDWSPERARVHPENVNAEGRVCVQIGVLGRTCEPFTAGALLGIEAIVNWLDSWGVSRRWPSGPPEGDHLDLPDTVPTDTAAQRSRVAWARGGHFGASQVPGCANAGPGAIDIDRITGPHGRQVRPRGLPVPHAEAAVAILA